MKIRVGIDVVCRADHQASCADETGVFVWSGHRFRTDPGDLEALWARLPVGAEEVMVIIEPTRNAWVPLAAWFRRHGATVVVVPPEQSADLRSYYNKHAKTDRLDSKMLARMPLLHPEGLHVEETMGVGDPLKRAVKIRSGLVHRRTTSMQRLDCLLELMGPAWTRALGSDLTLTAFRFLAAYSNPHTVRRLGHRRLAAFLHRSSRGAWAQERATEILDAAAITIASWGDGFDFAELTADIAAEARLALNLCDEIHTLDKRINVLYTAADPAGIVRSAPGVGVAHPRSSAAWRPHPLQEPRRDPIVLRARPSPERLRCRSQHRRANQSRRRLPTRSAVQLRRPRPQDRPHHRGALSPAHDRRRQAPHLGTVHHRRRARHPDRRLPPRR